MMTTLNNILSTARTLFYKYGLKSVSMDDVAKEAGVSKKTIYEYFEDKKALVKAIVAGFIKNNRETISECSKKSPNAVEEVLVQVKLLYATLSDINYNFFHELERMYPQAWQELTAYKKETFSMLIINNLERGIAEGFFRADLPLQFTADMRLHQISTAIDPVNFSEKKYDVHQLMMSFTDFYLHAITTKEGKELINKYQVSI